MSPLAMWATSWAMTASTSSWVMFCNKPVDTATKAESRKAPVAKALGSPSKMPTSGMPMPDWSANLRTVSTIQASSALAGWLMTRTPEDILAIHLLMSSEIKAPPKPISKAKPSKAPKLRPLAVKNRFTPNKLATTPNTKTTARLVKTNRKIRFMSNFNFTRKTRVRCGEYRGLGSKIKRAARFPDWRTVFQAQGACAEAERHCGHRKRPPLRWPATSLEHPAAAGG